MTSTLPPTSRSLPIALIRAREGVMGPIRHMLSKDGITEQQWRILRVLAEHDTLTASEVCDKASLLPPSFTRIAAGMVQKDLIARHRSAKDRRSQSYQIAAKGQAIIDTHRAEAAAIVDGYKTQLGAERYEALLDFLEELSALK